MTNPIIPPAVAAHLAQNDDDESELPVNNPNLDEGESNDDGDTVDRDVAETQKSSERLSD